MNAWPVTDESKRIVPPPSVSSVLSCRAKALAKSRLPPLALVLPLKLLAAERTSVPLPIALRLPLPLTTTAKVQLSERSKTRLPLSLTPLLWSIEPVLPRRPLAACRPR